MKKLFYFLAVFIVFTLNSNGQSGWTLVDSGLPVGKGVGQISIGMYDNTALWGLAINDDGSIFYAFTRSLDGGNTWTAGTFNAGTGLSQLFAFDANTCWAVFNTGATQGLYKTIDGGSTWIKKGGVYGSSSFANVVHFFDGMYGVAQGDPVGGEYEIYVTVDGGETWTPVTGANIPNPTSGEYGITGNYCAYGDNIWFGTNQGRIFRSVDKGNTWTASLTVFGNTQVVNALMFDALHGFAYRSYLDLGIEPELNETTDGGLTWTSFTTIGPSYARYFYHIPGTINTVIGSSSDPSGMGISISEDGGHNWTEISYGYAFQASAWLDMETGWCGTFTTAEKSSGGMYIFGELSFDPPLNLVGPENVTIGDPIHLEWDAPGGGATGSILCVDRDGSFDGSYTDEWAIIQAALDANGLTYDYYEVTDLTLNGPDLATMLQYDIIIWFSGESWGYYGDDCMTATDENNVALFLDGGGSLFFSGIDHFYASYPAAGNFSAGQFPYDYLGVTSAIQDNWNIFSPDMGNVSGVTGSFAAGIDFQIQDIFTAKDGLYIDKITHMGQDLFNMTSPAPAGIAAVQYNAGNFKSIYTTVAISAVVDPTDLAAIMGSAIDWLSNKGSSKDLSGYNVYRDGNLIGSTTETFYDDMLLVSGTYQYYVTAVYENPAGESNPSNTITVDVITGIENLIFSNTSVFPNPANNLVYIKSDFDIQSVKVFNHAGQTIANERIGTKYYQFNASQFTPGLYMFQIETSEGSITKRIIIQ